MKPYQCNGLARQQPLRGAAGTYHAIPADRGVRATLGDDAKPERVAGVAVYCESYCRAVAFGMKALHRG